MRELASSSIGLLKNDSDFLPLNLNKLTSIAVVGPNAKARLVSGGGSAALKPSYFVTPYDGIVNAVHDAGLGGKVKIEYSEGVRSKSLQSRTAPQVRI